VTISAKCLPTRVVTPKLLLTEISPDLNDSDKHSIFSVTDAQRFVLLRYSITDMTDSICESR